MRDTVKLILRIIRMGRARRAVSPVVSVLSLSLMIITLLAPPASSQNADAGTVAFPFLVMGYDARSMAMGGAACAVQNGLYGVLSNPAAVGYVSGTQVMGGYRQVMMDVWGYPIGVAMPTRYGVFAPYLVALTSGDFNVIYEDGFLTDDRARSSYTALGVGWARTVGAGIAVGGAFKGAYHYIGAADESYSADGFAFDIGAQYRQRNDRVAYGVALRNLGFMRSGYWGEWNEYEMPYGVEAGVAFVPRHIPSLRIALDVNRFNGDYTNFEPAFEYTVVAGTFWVRGGYVFSMMDVEKMSDVFRGERDDTYRKSSVNTLSLGVGVATAFDNVDIKLDAAMQFYTDISSPAIIVSLLVGF
ncbi:MAG: hypothetical protein LBB74_05175 [Chitinispirillales bacterium]|jgi:hypothetical protein|nr:hypothetical protein [Chitinispirillales bacterium]